MPLGPHIPEWAELRRTLTDLARDANALYAYVLDNRLNLWCTSDRVEDGDESPAFGIIQKELAQLGPPLHRGGRLDQFAERRRAGHAYVRSFSGIYVLLLRFSAPRALPAVRDAVVCALPRIDALVAAMPPPDGPGTEGGENVTVA